MSKQNIHIAKLLPFLTDFNKKHRAQPVTLRLQEGTAAPVVQEQGLPLLGLDLDREGPLAPCIEIMLGVETAVEGRHLTHTVPRVSEVVLEVGSDGEDLQLNIESDAGGKAILQLD
jgi:hypothetical protein